jgi:cytochrome c oxidase subunit IV
MSTETQSRPPQQDVSGWAVGGIVFAATMMVLIGVFQALAGLVAIFNDEFYVVTQNYTFDLDVSVWGWIHLLVGLGVLATGFGLFGRRPWAGVATIMLCMLSALVNFFFIPYYPIWSLLVIGLNVWVIWAVTRPGAIETS